MSSGGTADPERMNCPVVWRASISWRMTFHKDGASCHSSISRGVSPASTPSGSSSASSMALGEASRRIELRAWWRPVEVLPHARGPSSTTPPMAWRSRWTRPSIARGRYTMTGAYPNLRILRTALCGLLAPHSADPAGLSAACDLDVQAPMPWRPSTRPRRGRTESVLEVAEPQASKSHSTGPAGETIRLPRCASPWMIPGGMSSGTAAKAAIPASTRSAPPSGRHGFRSPDPSPSPAGPGYGAYSRSVGGHGSRLADRPSGQGRGAPGQDAAPTRRSRASITVGATSTP
jgi:hypothetical protein